MNMKQAAAQLQKAMANLWGAGPKRSSHAKASRKKASARKARSPRAR
jgi:hypothetical protein